MAQHVEIFDVVIPPSTLQAAPFIQDLDLPVCEVRQLELRWPPGPSGLVGIRVRHSDTTVIPRRQATWLVANNEVVVWPLEDYPTAPSWSVAGYNLDIYEHTIQVRVLYNHWAGDGQSTVEPITIVQPNQEAVAPEDQEG